MVNPSKRNIPGPSYSRPYSPSVGTQRQIDKWRKYEHSKNRQALGDGQPPLNKRQ
jgi:hypothetical protein